MAIVRALINKNTLSYICSSKGISPEFIVSRTKQNVENVTRWLMVSDQSLPTIRQAKQIANCLHIPFAALYMNPEQIPIKRIPSIRNLRTLRDGYVDDSSLNIAVYDILLERDFLIEMKREFEQSTPSFSMVAPASDDPIEWANLLRSFLSISLEDQFRCPSPRQFYLRMRERMEAAGLFVHCFSDVDVECARGFAIFELVLPIIGVNDSDRPPAKTFTLIHELVHILKRESTYCNDMSSSSYTAAEEVFCNAVAGEFLVPKRSLELFLKSEKILLPISKESIERIATHYSVSREVIIRRLLAIDVIDPVEYDTYAEIFRHEIERDREARRTARQKGLDVGIPRNISYEAIDRTSPAVSIILYHGYVEEFFSKKDIARHLGIDQKHIDKYLTEVSTWTN